MSEQDPTTHLGVVAVARLHELVMLATGATPALPVRDHGVLISALHRPVHAALYDDADLIRQAALLAVGISQAQAFLDGNKRTAFAACDVFLRQNGHEFTGDPVELAKQLEAVAERKGSLDKATREFEEWLRQRVVEQPE